MFTFARLLTGMAWMVYNKRLGLFNLREAEKQESDTAELNDGNAPATTRKEVSTQYTHTNILMSTHTHISWIIRVRFYKPSMG